MNFINLISLFVLVTVFCILFGGYAGGFNFEDGIKTEDLEPFNNKEYMLKIKKYCPNLSSDRLACCYQTQMSNILFPINYIFSKTDRQECHDSFRDLLCEINCNPNQNKYVDVLEKKKSQLFHGKYFAKKISAKIDLKSANKYYENCKDAKIYGQTIYEAFGKPKSAPYLFTKFVNDFYKIDYRYYDKENNETFHLVQIKPDDSESDDSESHYKKEPIVDSKEILPWVFEK